MKPTGTHGRLAAVALVSILIACAGCEKEKYHIGKDNPEVEIQKCVKLSEKKRFEEAVECLEIFKSRFSQTTLGTEAELAIGDNYFNQKEYLLAADSYSSFVTMHPHHAKADYAYYKLGLSYFNESPKAIDRDQQYLDDAIKYLTVVVSAYPESSHYNVAKDELKEAKERVAARLFYIGNFYYRDGEYRASVPRFIDLVNDYPDSARVPEALFKLVSATCGIKMIEEAKLFYSKLATDFPQSRWTKKAEAKLERHVKENEAAPADGKER